MRYVSECSEIQNEGAAWGAVEEVPGPSRNNATYTRALQERPDFRELSVLLGHNTANSVESFGSEA